MDLTCTFSSSSLSGANAGAQDTGEDVEASITITVDPDDDPTHVVRELCVAEGLPADFTRSFAALVQDVVDEASRAAPLPQSSLTAAVITASAASASSSLLYSDKPVIARPEDTAAAAAQQTQTIAETAAAAWATLLRAGRIPAAAAADAAADAADTTHTDGDTPDSAPSGAVAVCASASASALAASAASHAWATAYQAVIARRDLRGALFACVRNLAAATRLLHRARAGAFAALTTQHAREMETVMRQQVRYICQNCHRSSCLATAHTLISARNTYIHTISHRIIFRQYST